MKSPETIDTYILIFKAVLIMPSYLLTILVYTLLLQQLMVKL